MTARLLFVLLIGLVVLACTPLARDASPATDDPQSAPTAPTQAAAVDPAAPSPRPMPRTGGPLPPEQVGRPGVQLDYRCRTDADCTVKDVGNCCGYYPQCLNKDSPTDPKAVQAECARTGMASVCGFAELGGCRCVRGRCEGIPAGEGVVR